MSHGVILENIRKILQDADYKIQQSLLLLIEDVFIKEGFQEVFDSWGEDLTWMKQFIPKY